MRGVRWVLLLYVHALAATNPRSVNLALETTFEFNEKRDMAFIKNMRQFFDKIEGNVEKKLIARERSDGYRFTDFLQELIAVIAGYDDNYFRSVFKEIYHMTNNLRKGGMDMDDMMNGVLRPAMLEVMRKSSETPTRLQKDRLRRISSLLGRTDKSHASFVNFLNLLYKEKSVTTMRRILRGFKLVHKRPDPDAQLRKLVRNTIEYLVFDHYAGLDESVKRDVGKWLRGIFKVNFSPASRHTLSRNVTRAPLKMTRYTFITLYPEEMDYKVKRFEHEPTRKWRRVTVKNQGRYLLVRGERRANGGKASEDSEESSWSSLEIATTVRNSAATTNRKYSQRRISLTEPNYQSKSIYMGHSYRREINDSVQVEAENTTLHNDSISNSYYQRLKQLEDQLHAMKTELSARMALPDLNGAQTDIEIQNMDVYRNEFETDMKNVSDPAENKETNATEVKAADRGGPAQTRFKTAQGGANNSLILGDSQLSSELMEFLKNKPQIIQFTKANVTGVVPRVKDKQVNDTVTNSTETTTEENEIIIFERRSVDKMSTGTVPSNITNKFVDVSQGHVNVTRTTTKMETSTIGTTVEEIINFTTSKNDYVNKTLVI